MQKIKLSKYKFILISLILTLGISISGAFLFAWTSPTGNPAPADNTNPPIYDSGNSGLPAINAGQQLTVLGDLTAEGETRLGNYTSLPSCDVSTNLGAIVFLESSDQPYICAEGTGSGEWQEVRDQFVCTSCVSIECGDNGHGTNCGSCTLPEICKNGACIDYTSNYGYKVITTCAELQALDTAPSARVILGNDIDCSMTSTWNSGAGFDPINGGASCADATIEIFDGNGFTIDGLYINRPADDCVGLFGSIEMVINLGLTNINITGNSAGGIAAQASGMRNVYVTGQMTVTNGGGLMNEDLTNVSSIYNSYTDVNITSDGEIGKIGGLVGYFRGYIQSSYALGDIAGFYTTNTNGATGGLVGQTIYAEIYNSYTTGNISGGYSVGGIVGTGSGAKIYRTYTTGNISNGRYTGGLVGRNSYDTKYSYSAATVTGTISSYTGSLVGYGGDVAGCYWDKTKTSYGCNGKTTCSGNIGLTTAEMTDDTNFINSYFSFFEDAVQEADWKLDSIRPAGTYYPCLLWQDDSTCPTP